MTTDTLTLAAATRILVNAHREGRLPTAEEVAPIHRHLFSRAARRDQLVWVYAIQAGEDGPIKVGVTRSPMERLATLQQGNAEELRGLAAWRDFPTEEKFLHEDFAHARIRGEWFRPVPELVEYVLREGCTYVWS